MIHRILPLVLAFALGPAAAAQEKPAIVAHDARIAGDGMRTRFVADLSGTVDLSVFTLADPYRVVVDLPEIAFRLPAESGRQGRGLVSAWRYGRLAPGRSRIVLDAAGPVAVDKAFVLAPVADQPARLVVDLVPVDRETFLRTVAVNRRTEPALSPRPAPRETEQPVVVIDPGHGGLDPGAMGPGGVPEKAIMLDFARALKAKLEHSGRLRVVLTREDDRFVALSERVRIARENKAALFLSIHADSIGVASVRGAIVYVLSETASDAEAAALADKENRADIVSGFDLAEPDDVVADILIDLAQRETRNLSLAAARGIVNALKSAVRLNRNSLRAASFRVLKAPDVPSLLIELGFLSSRQDARLLVSDDWRERTAQAVAGAVEAALSLRTAHAP